MDMFPLNYVRNSFSPILAFKNRRYLKIWQMVIILFVLTGCLLMPMSFSLGRINQVSLIDYVPEAVGLVTEDFVEEMSTIHTTAAGLDITSEHLIMEESGNILAFYPDESSALAAIEDKTGILLTPTSFLIQETGRPLIQQTYLSDSQLISVNSAEELVNELSRQWFESNRLSVVLTNFINVWLLMLLSSLFLILGSSLFLSFMKLGNLFSIKSYREAMHLCLHAFLIPTLIAMLIGLFSQDPITMLSFQGIGFVLVLLWIYWKTHFQDRYVAKQLKEVGADAVDEPIKAVTYHKQLLSDSKRKQNK